MQSSKLARGDIVSLLKVTIKRYRKKSITVRTTYELDFSGSFWLLTTRLMDIEYLISRPQR